MTAEDHEGTTAIPVPGPGDSRIADAIVAKIAASATREVDGVVALRDAPPRRGWLRIRERRRGGASVRVTDNGAAIEVRLVAREGAAIPELIEAVRTRITDRIERETGRRVEAVNVSVVDIDSPPWPDDEASGARPGDAVVIRDPGAGLNRPPGPQSP